MGTLRTRIGPWLVWLATVAGAVLMWADMRHSPAVVGFVEGGAHVVAPRERAPVASLAVDVGQEVVEGQVLALLDASAVDAEISIAEAERARAEAEVAAAGAAFLRAASAEERDLAVDLARAERELASARADLAGAAAEQRAQRAERDRLRTLVAERLADRDGLAASEARVATLGGRVDGAKARIAVMERQVAEARTRLDEASRGALQVVIGPARRTLDVIDARLQALRQRKTAHVLRSPTAGRVAAVLLGTGGVAGPRTPVVSVVTPGSGRVVACLAEEQALDVRVGDRATLWPRKRGAEALIGHVVALGPLVEEVPARCRPNLQDRAWGRDVVVLLDDPAELLPGQALDVRLETEPSRRGARASGPAPLASAPSELRVPEALRARSRFEPSGLAWSQRHLRYVVASAVTGPAASPDEMPAWLFTMDARGHVDPAPRPVVGDAALRRPAALAAASGSALHALAPPAPGAATTALWRLQVDGEGFRAEAVSDLGPLLAGLPQAERDALGLAAGVTPELSGLAVWPDGSLLIGLAAPLDERGRARIWRLARPESLHATGRLDDAGLGSWGTVALQARSPAGSAPAGVAGLLTLPDGGLVVASNPVRPGAVGGALWRVDRDGNALAARRIHAWPTLQPRALALAPTAGRLVVVLAAAEGAAQWLEVPWPRP